MTKFCATDHKTLSQARSARMHSNDQFELVRLNKNGTPSKMFDARSTYSTEDRAREVVARVRKLNPSMTMRYALNGTEI